MIISLRRFHYLIFLLSSLISAPVHALSYEQLKRLATSFVELKQARQQPDTTSQDIDNFIALFADEFTDEHVKFGVMVTEKSALRSGMLAKLEDKIDFCALTITNMMVGDNVVFLRYSEHARVKPAHMNRKVEYTSFILLSIEYNELGEIVHLRRHHGRPQQNDEQALVNTN